MAFNDLAKQPEPRDMIKATTKINLAVYSSLFFLVLLALIWQFLIKK
jgi:adenosylcobinamide-phosphate synthase